MTAALDGAFADPVHDSQRCFRAVLDAMASPGRIHAVSGVTPPAGVGTAAGAVLLALADQDTPLWLDGQAAEAKDWITFHAGAPVVSDPARCAFALALSFPDLEPFAAGTHEEPETSATLICQVASFASGTRYRLTGPGLQEPRVVTVQGLPDDFAALWQRNHALFPRGIDLILCAGGHLTALPRTVAIREV